MTFAQIYAKVQQQIGDNSTPELGKIKNDINRAYQDINIQAGDKAYWLETHDASVSTTAGTASYSLASDVHKIQTVRDTTNERILQHIDYRNFIRTHPAIDTTNDRGTPKFWYYDGLDSSNYLKIGLYPVPDATITIKYDYLKDVSDITSESTIPILPSRYHYLLADFACWQYYEREQDPTANYFSVKYDNGIKKMLEDMGESDTQYRIRDGSRDVVAYDSEADYYFIKL